MGSSVLSLVQQAAGEIGMAPPVALVNGTDTTTSQWLAIARRCGNEVYRFGRWSELNTEFLVQLQPPVNTVATGTAGAFSLTVSNPALCQPLQNAPAIYAALASYLTTTCRVVAADANSGIVTLTEPVLQSFTGAAVIFSQDTYALPQDFGSFIAGTYWDRGKKWELLGPLSPQEDQMVRSGVVAQGPRMMFRIAGRDQYRLILRPPPSSVTITTAPLVMEYTTKWWVTDGNSGSPKPDFTQDTDSVVWEDDLMHLGIQWMFLQRKGMAYQELQAEWVARLRTALAVSNPGRKISFSNAGMGQQLISPDNIQDGNFPSRKGL
jgi:hypothetical protein